MIKLFLLSSAAITLLGEVHTMTLKEAAGRALRESPEALISRIDEQNAVQRMRVAKDPFVPKIYAGSGLAYSNGFPMSIEGSAPSVVQARAVASVYNRQQRFQLAQAKEDMRGAAIDGQSRRDEAMASTIQLFLNTERKLKLVELARKQMDTAKKLEELVKSRVEEGREIPLEAKKSTLEVAKAEQRIETLQIEADYAQGELAMVLGFPPGDRVHPANEERPPAGVPDSLEEAVTQALAESREIRRLESSMIAKSLEAKAERSARFPKFDLVAQYGLFAKFNHYEDYFRVFQRNNGQLGVSIQVPLLFGPAIGALTAQAEGEMARLRIEMNQTRSRITLDTEKRFQDLKRAEKSRQVSRMDLEVARESLSNQLARMEEGRSMLKQVEEARLAEQEKWIAYFEAQHTLERVKYALLERTGGLMAALK